jgi:hypothetical protein
MIPDNLVLLACERSLELGEGTVPEWLYWNWLKLGKDLQKKIEAVAIDPKGTHWERLATLWYVEPIKAVKHRTPRFRKFPKGVRVV